LKKRGPCSLFFQVRVGSDAKSLPPLSHDVRRRLGRQYSERKTPSPPQTLSVPHRTAGAPHWLGRRKIVWRWQAANDLRHPAMQDSREYSGWCECVASPVDCGPAVLPSPSPSLPPPPLAAQRAGHCGLAAREKELSSSGRVKEGGKGLVALLRGRQPLAFLRRREGGRGGAISPRHTTHARTSCFFFFFFLAAEISLRTPHAAPDFSLQVLREPTLFIMRSHAVIDRGGGNWAPREGKIANQQQLTADRLEPVRGLAPPRRGRQSAGILASRRQRSREWGPRDGHRIGSGTGWRRREGVEGENRDKMREKEKEIKIEWPRGKPPHT